MTTHWGAITALSFSLSEGSQDELLRARLPFALTVSDLDADPLVIEPEGSTTLTWEGSERRHYSLTYDQTTIDVTGMALYTVQGITERPPSTWPRHRSSPGTSCP